VKEGERSDRRTREDLFYRAGHARRSIAGRHRRQLRQTRMLHWGHHDASDLSIHPRRLSVGAGTARLALPRKFDLHSDDQPFEITMDSHDYRATIHPNVDCGFRGGPRAQSRRLAGRRASTWFIRPMRGRDHSIPSRLLHGRVAFTTVIASAVVAGLVGIGIGTNRQASSAGVGVVAEPASIGANATSTAGLAAAATLSDSAALASGSRFDVGLGTDLARFREQFLRIIFPSSTTAGARAWSTLADRPASDADSPQMALYDGRPIRVARTITMRVTAYSPDYRSCGASADGITASGYSVFTNGGCMVAADPRVLPLGSLVSVPGYDGGAVVPVLDTGGAIKGDRLDVLYATHEVAKRWGVQDLEVQVWEYADGLPSDFKRLRRSAK